MRVNTRKIRRDVLNKIITVTLNPSLDRTLFVHHMVQGYPNTVAETTRLDAAGRGVNISHALKAMDTETHAIVLLGSDAIGKAYEALINEAPFATTLIRSAGQTRSNTIIYDSGTKQETQIIEDSDLTDEGEALVDRIEQTLLDGLEAGDTVCLTGILPRGVPTNIYAQLTQAVKAAGGKVVMAAERIALEIGLKANPDIVALRHHELEGYFNYPVRTLEDAIFSARKMSARAEGSVVLIAENELTYGVIVDEQRSWLATAPETESDEGTTSGIHDAFLAGFLSHYRGSDDMTDALTSAMAAAAYTRSHAGNAFGTPENVQERTSSIEISETPA
jgi:1-phosphofructokinase family hexose kinase